MTASREVLSLSLKFYLPKYNIPISLPPICLLGAKAPITLVLDVYNHNLGLAPCSFVAFSASGRYDVIALVTYIDVTAHCASRSEETCVCVGRLRRIAGRGELVKIVAYW